MKIIFLDIDGVLVNRNSFRNPPKALLEKADPPCVSALNSITDATGARIVVSSTWRMGRKLIEMREILASWGVTGKVVGMTPVIRVTRAKIVVSPERGEEVQKWLDTCRYPTDSYVILDDDEDFRGEMASRLIKTVFEYGLQPEHATRAIHLLGAA